MFAKTSNQIFLLFLYFFFFFCSKFEMKTFQCVLLIEPLDALSSVLHLRNVSSFFLASKDF